MTEPYEPFLTAAVKNALIAHMDEAGEEECCGTVTLSGGEYAYEPSKNVSKSPRERFTFSTADRNRIVRSKAVVAYAHSHPRGEAYPSQLDQVTQRNVGKPAIIVARTPKHGQISVFSHGDHLLDAPLMGRMFRHAVFDCFEAIRSFVWQVEGRKIDPYPRPAEWWDEGIQKNAKHKDVRDLYSRFGEQGYREFPVNVTGTPDEFSPKLGDLLLMKVGKTDVRNHGAVYAGENEVYQHFQGRRSGTTPLGYVLDAQYDALWIRHESKFK